MAYKYLSRNLPLPPKLLQAIKNFSMKSLAQKISTKVTAVQSSTIIQNPKSPNLQSPLSPTIQNPSSSNSVKQTIPNSIIQNPTTKNTIIQSATFPNSLLQTPITIKNSNIQQVFK